MRKDGGNRRLDRQGNQRPRRSIPDVSIVDSKSFKSKNHGIKSVEIPSCVEIPSGIEIPESVEIPSGIEIPESVEIPSGIEIPKGVELSEREPRPASPQEPLES